jgi:hypothetical protein
VVAELKTYEVTARNAAGDTSCRIQLEVQSVEKASSFNFRQELDGSASAPAPKVSAAALQEGLEQQVREVAATLIGAPFTKAFKLRQCKEAADNSQLYHLETTLPMVRLYEVQVLAAQPAEAHQSSPTKQQKKAQQQEMVSTIGTQFVQLFAHEAVPAVQVNDQGNVQLLLHLRWLEQWLLSGKVEGSESAGVLRHRFDENADAWMRTGDALIKFVNPALAKSVQCKMEQHQHHIDEQGW